MKKLEKGEKSPAIVVLFSTLGGVVVTMALMLLGAVLVQRSVVSERAITPLALAFLMLGTVFAAFISVRGVVGGKLLWALVAGLSVYALLFISGMLLWRQSVNLLRTAISLACALSGVLLGAILGMGGNKKKKTYKGRHTT